MNRLLLAALVFFFLVGMAWSQEDTVEKITILGNVKVEDGVIRGAIKSREGRPLLLNQVRDDIRSIYGLGYFTDVGVDIKSMPKGKELIFVVVEKPSIKEVVITGNDKVKLEDIKEKVTIQPRSILNLDKVKDNAEQIRKLYFSKGYYGVKVNTKVDPQEPNEAVVTFQIEEGPKGKIKSITFKGNEHIKASDLRKIMQTKEWNILSFMTQSGVLDEDVLKNDTQLLAAYYVDHGYLEVKVSDPKVDLTDPERIRIEFDISEGPQFHVGDVDFKGDVLTTKEELFPVIQTKRNNVYSLSAVRKDVNTLTELFAGNGYAYVDVTPEPSVDRPNLLVNLTFNIEKKKRVSFERIQMAGNTKTRDKVIRRELQFTEGDLYNVTALNDSQSRIRRLGFFKEVEFTTSRGTTDDKINLDIKVEEANTGALAFGAGYSSLYDVVGTASISDRNLFGLGYNAMLRAKIGTGGYNDFRLTFTDPYFLGYPYSVGVDGYHENVDFFDTYSYKVTGGDLRVGKELTPKWVIEGMYKLETLDVFDVSIFADRTIKDQRGKSTTSAITLALTSDTRNDYFAPSKGARTVVSGTVAGGVLQGDNDFLKGLFGTSYFFPLPYNLVLNLRGRVGGIDAYGGTDVPINEKFYVGGIATVRGYEYGMAGPVDFDGDPVGSDYMLVFNSELIFPIVRELGLRGAVFWDVGKGFDQWSDVTPIKTGVGVGLRWFSPFGPLAIDLGFNPNPQAHEKSYVLEFNMGTAF
jgi:outer membrane protein insertion porin family